MIVQTKNDAHFYISICYRLFADIDFVFVLLVVETFSHFVRCLKVVALLTFECTRPAILFSSTYDFVASTDTTKMATYEIKLSKEKTCYLYAYFQLTR